MRSRACLSEVFAEQGADSGCRAVGDSQTPCKFALKVIHAQEAGAQAVRFLAFLLLQRPAGMLRHREQTPARALLPSQAAPLLGSALCDICTGSWPAQLRALQQLARAAEAMQLQCQTAAAQPLRRLQPERAEACAAF